jgi:hypothetical protein
MSKISTRDAFVHVADSYRWLAAAACSWQDLKHGGLSSQDLTTVNRLLPNADVAVQASALIYARGLIEFYRRASTETGASTKADDIGAKSHFGVIIDNDDQDLKYLIEVKDSIDKHLAHLTEFRDPRHPGRTVHQRLEWNDEIPKIVEALVRLLGKVTKDAKVSCLAEFTRLVDAVQARRSNRASSWPDLSA